MNKVYFILLLLISPYCFAQYTYKPEDKKSVAVAKDTIRLKNYPMSADNFIYDLAEVDFKPFCRAGDSKLFDKIINNIDVPENDRIAGEITVSFVVEKDGRLDDFKVIKDIGPGTGQTVVSSIKNYEKWKPGILNNEAVRTLVYLTIGVLPKRSRTTQFSTQTFHYGKS